MAILHRLPIIIAEKDGAAQYLCKGCGKITDWLARPTEPLKDARCKCGFIVEKIPQIMEGPRPEDGKVKYKCDNCNSTTNWQKPPQDGYAVSHGCRSDVLALVQNSDGKVDVRMSPCASGMLADAEMKLVMASKKTKERTPELTRFIENEILPKFNEMKKLIVQDTLKEAQEQT